MKVLVKLFGSLREEIGAAELEFELSDGACVRTLSERLAQDHSIFERMSERLAVSVDMEIVEADHPLHDGAEVAYLPPVAGGASAASLCTISSEPLDEAAVAARVEGPEMGGVVSFVGRVRNHARGREIQFLEYEAYPEMAEREMEKIAEEAGKRWPGTRVAIAHRVGHLEIGDAAVVIAAASHHRAEAFEACRFAIDTLKLTVPIWKKEVATDGEYWVDDHA